MIEKDAFDNFGHWILHHRAQAAVLAALAVAVVVLLAIAGCSATTPGLTTEGRVDGATFEAQAAALTQQINTMKASLDAKQQELDKALAALKERAANQVLPRLPSDRPPTDAEVGAMESYFAAAKALADDQKKLAVEQSAMNIKTAELSAQAQAAAQRVEAGFADLDRQNQARNEVLTFATRTAASVGSGNPIDIGATLLGLGTIGAGLFGWARKFDASRSDAIIADLKKAVPPANAPASPPA